MKESVNRTFNQFKIHTQYSICEGAVKIDQLNLNSNNEFFSKSTLESHIYLSVTT